ncbi:MAG TPA: hypothetical protein DCF68_21820 [Cyanothece sp. UBA12306]|nr:hypothetical protein [Cyanothece sp. UBA12306]
MLQLRQIAPLAGTLLSLAVADTAQALAIVNPENIVINVETQFDPFGNPVTGITSVENINFMDGLITETYKIDFQFDPFNDVFGPPPSSNTCDTPSPSNTLCFWDDPVRGGMAITAVVDAINIQQPGIDQVIADTVTGPPFLNPIPSPSFSVPISFDGTDIMSIGGLWNGSMWSMASFNNPPSDFDMYGLVTLTQKTVVNEPSNLVSIIAIGTIMILGFRYKSKFAS